MRNKLDRLAVIIMFCFGQCSTEFGPPLNDCILCTWSYIVILWNISNSLTECCPCSDKTRRAISMTTISYSSTKNEDLCFVNYKLIT